MAQSNPDQKVGLVLSGGGARGAYQAGVMKAVTEIANQGEPSLPISIITGISAGAINAAFMAATWNDPVKSCRDLVDTWARLTTDQIFRTDIMSLSHIGARWLADTAFGNLRKRKKAHSLLDTQPLRELLNANIPTDRIQEQINKGHLEAAAITAMDYNNANSVTWVQGRDGIKLWDRNRRESRHEKISVEHVMASSAIPLFFPSVKVGETFYGDGCLRNTAPLSPAIHLGANKLIVVSVRRPDHLAPPTPLNTTEPSIARVLGVMMNAVLLDAIEVDMERMSRVNNTLKSVPPHLLKEMSLRPVEYLWIRPSEDIGLLAAGKYEKLPNIMRYLIGGLGGSGESSELTSYLLFDPEYCGKLIELGYQDAMNSKDEIKRFLASPSQSFQAG